MGLCAHSHEDYLSFNRKLLFHAADKSAAAGSDDMDLLCVRARVYVCPVICILLDFLCACIHTVSGASSNFH